LEARQTILGLPILKFEQFSLEVPFGDHTPEPQLRHPLPSEITENFEHHNKIL